MCGGQPVLCGRGREVEREGVKGWRDGRQLRTQKGDIDGKGEQAWM